MTVSPITSDQEDQLNALIAVALKRVRSEVNPGKDGYQRLFARGGEFQDYVVAGIRRFTAKEPDYTLAKSILGGDFITPEEIMVARPLVYTDEQIAALASQIPSENILRWCKDNGFSLMAAPPSPLSLLDFRSLKADHFYLKTGGWYAKEGQTFAAGDKTSFGWLMIRKTPVPNSTNKNWGEQSQLLSNVESVPNTSEMSWFITTFFEVRGVRLFENVYVRTSSLGSDGDRVFVGYFGAEGLFVDSYWAYERSSNLGVASTRKF